MAVDCRIVLLWLAGLFISSSVAFTPQMMRGVQMYQERLHRIRLASVNQTTISPECNNSLLAFLEVNNSAVQAQYADAVGKPGAGVSVGNVAWLGSYGECTAIPGASYCLVGMTLQTNKGNKSTTPANIRWGLCVPKECNEKDVTVGLEDIIKALGLMSFIHLTGGVAPPNIGVHCAKPSKYTSGVIATIIFCGVVLFVCLCGTIIEVSSEYMHPGTETVRKNDGFMPITNEPPTEDDESFTSNGYVEKRPGSSSFSESRPVILVYPKTKNVVLEFFLCFSLIRNTNRILDTNVPPNAITCINGMRVLSISWVILGHVYIWQLFTGITDNILIEVEILHRFTFQGIINASFSVDSFFFLSGLLAAYLSLREMERSNGKLNLFQFYFHRFWRLTPAYMFVVLFYDKLTGFLGEGPVWYKLQSNEPCDKYWWTNLLYINNFYPTHFGEMCMTWSWYLANDMQFYVISPLILIAAYRYGPRGLAVTVGVLFLGCFIATAVIVDKYQFSSPLNANAFANANAGAGQGDFQSYVYAKPYCRIAPYLVGIALGYLFHVTKDSPKPPRLWFIACGWCTAIVLALAPLYGTYRSVRKIDPVPLTHTENIMYDTFSRCSWALALAWVVYACHIGYGGLVNKILSARFWIPLSRLTYCVYLVQTIVISVYFGSYQSNIFYSDMNVSWHFIAAVSVSYMVAFIVSVTFEVPMMQLEKLIFKTDRKRD